MRTTPCLIGTAIICSFFCFPCTGIALADIATPKLPPVITAEDIELVRQNRVAVNVTPTHRNRISVALSSPAVCLQAKLPGPGVMTYELRDAQKGKLLVKKDCPLDNMDFSPVANCVKGRGEKYKRSTSLLGKGRIIGVYPPMPEFDEKTCYYGTAEYDFRMYKEDIWFNSHLVNGRGNFILDVTVRLDRFEWQGATPVLLSKNGKSEKFRYKVSFVDKKLSIE